MGVQNRLKRVEERRCLLEKHQANIAGRHLSRSRGSLLLSGDPPPKPTIFQRFPKQSNIHTTQAYADILKLYISIRTAIAIRSTVF